MTLKEQLESAFSHFQAGRPAEAEKIYRQVLTEQPDHPDALHMLGILAARAGHFDSAIQLIQRAIAVHPGHPFYYGSLGNVLQDMGRLNESIASFRQSIQISPKFAEAHNNLGIVLRDTGQLDEAIAAYRQAIAHRPNYAEAYSNLGNALREKGQIDEAIAACRQAIVLRHDHAAAHTNLAMALLLRGDFEHGWPEYEWRSKSPGFASLQPVFPQSLWDGGDLAGRTILLRAEQGIGDTIQFIRYVPLVIQRGGRVLVEVPPELIRLLKQLAGVEQWIPRGHSPPAFDVQCPLLSLPYRFATTVKTIPAQRDLLKPDPNLAQAWHDRLAQCPPGLKVGLVWAGNSKNKNDRNRSMSLSVLESLATINGIHFYSLQKGEAARQITNQPGIRIVDWTNELKDFADTAALIAELDLIITVETSVAHLAGAMGKRVWVLLQFIPDWRWLLDGDQSPWYPTMRLFRQKKAGDWAGVISGVLEALAGEEWSRA